LNFNNFDCIPKYISIAISGGARLLDQGGKHFSVGRQTSRSIKKKKKDSIKKIQAVDYCVDLLQRATASSTSIKQLNVYIVAH